MGRARVDAFAYSDWLTEVELVLPPTGSSNLADWFFVVQGLRGSCSSSITLLAYGDLVYQGAGYTIGAVEVSYTV